jgi:hypothetical protein
MFRANQLFEDKIKFGKRLRAERDKFNNGLNISSPFPCGIRGRQVLKILARV